MMTTSMPWLKIAPNCGGQCRMQVSQLMQIDMSIRSGARLPLRVAFPGGDPLGSCFGGHRGVADRDLTDGQLVGRLRLPAIATGRPPTGVATKGVETDLIQTRGSTEMAKYQFLTEEWVAAAKRPARAVRRRQRRLRHTSSG